MVRFSSLVAALKKNPNFPKPGPIRVFIRSKFQLEPKHLPVKVIDKKPVVVGS
jgi:hypothetical protein